MSHYTMLSKYGNHTRLLINKNKLKIGCFLQIRLLDIFLGVFNKTIIQLTPVGYEMIIANWALRALFAIHHLISNEHLWNNC